MIKHRYYYLDSLVEVFLQHQMGLLLLLQSMDWNKNKWYWDINTIPENAPAINDTPCEFNLLSWSDKSLFLFDS